MTPLGSPVDPDEYNQNAVSSLETLTASFSTLIDNSFLKFLNLLFSF